MTMMTSCLASLLASACTSEISNGHAAIQCRLVDDAESRMAELLAEDSGPGAAAMSEASHPAAVAAGDATAARVEVERLLMHGQLQQAFRQVPTTDILWVSYSRTPAPTVAVLCWLYADASSESL